MPVIGLFLFSVSSCVSFGHLCDSRNKFIYYLTCWWTIVYGIHFNFFKFVTNVLSFISVLVICVFFIVILVSEGKRLSIALILSKSQLLMLLILFFGGFFGSYISLTSAVIFIIFFFLLAFTLVSSLWQGCWIGISFFFNVGDYGYKFPSVFCLCCISHVLVCSVFHLSQSILISWVIPLTHWLF